MSDDRPGAPLSPRGAGVGPRPAQESERVLRVFPRRKLGEASRSADHAVLVSVEMIHEFRNMSMKDAAKKLGLPPTAMKGACRRLGIMAWPFKTAKDTRNVKRWRNERIWAEAAARASAMADDSDTSAPKTPPSAVLTPPPPTPTFKCIQSPRGASAGMVPVVRDAIHLGSGASALLAARPRPLPLPLSPALPLPRVFPTAIIAITTTATTDATEQLLRTKELVDFAPANAPMAPLAPFPAGFEPLAEDSTFAASLLEAIVSMDVPFDASMDVPFDSPDPELLAPPPFPRAGGGLRWEGGGLWWEGGEVMAWEPFSLSLGRWGGSDLSFLTGGVCGY
ncbi:hypothetical protein T484DRAFT_1959671 [Baffinella frigidus]|nr:hypothetical protein T484DRAFT_1959671 [Cryptophyta sp. CCMP2293]